MFTAYIHYLMEQSVYEKDESHMIVASIPWYQWLFSQWKNFEEARDNLIDAIQSVLYLKIKLWDEKIIQDIEKFSTHNAKMYV